MSRKIKKWLKIFLLPVLLLSIGSKVNAEEINSRIKIPEANKLPLSSSSIFKPITPGQVISVPAKYTFQPKATPMTTVKVIDDTGDITPAKGIWKKGFNKSTMSTHPYIIASHMGMVNNRWIDVKLVPLSTKSADPFFIGLNKDNDGSIAQTARESLFTISDTKDSEPTLMMQFVDNLTGNAVQLPGGHMTYGDIDNDEWMNYSSINAGLDSIYSWGTTKLKVDMFHNTSNDFTVSSEGMKDISEINKDYWYTVSYNETSSINLKFNAQGSAIIFSYHEFDELMFELAPPNKLGDTDGNVNDEEITYSIYQDVPYRSALAALSKFSIKDSIPTGLDIVSVKVFNNNNLDVTNRFTINTMNNQVSVVGNSLMLTNTAKETYRVDIKTKLNKTENYMQYYNDALGQLEIPNTATTNYTNSPNNESYELNSPVAYGHIKMDKPNTPPDILLDKNKDISTGKAYTVTGKWRDLDSQSVIIMYSVDGLPAKFGQFYTNPKKGVYQPFTFEIPASEIPLGNHTIEVFAGDTEGLISNVEKLLLEPAAASLIISFIDENGADIILPITQAKTIGDSIDLTTDSDVLLAIDEVKAKYYDLIDWPIEKFTIENAVTKISYKFSGQLVFVSAPSKIDFGLKSTTSFSEVNAEKPIYNIPLVVLDNRANNQEWKLTVQVTDPLTTSDKSSVLPDALIYKRGKDEDILATGVTALISQQASVKGTEFNVSKEEWEEKGNGFQFNLKKGQSRKMEEYKATILYSLGETP